MNKGSKRRKIIAGHLPKNEGDFICKSEECIKSGEVTIICNSCYQERIIKNTMKDLIEANLQIMTEEEEEALDDDDYELHTHFGCHTKHKFSHLDHITITLPSTKRAKHD